MNSSILGSTGFIGQHLLSALHGAEGVSLRQAGWERGLSNADVIINLVGKAHDHQGTATEADYHQANVALAKEVFKAFLASPTARLMIHVSSLAALEEFESTEALVESDSCRPVSWYGQSKRKAEEWLLAQKLPPNKKLIIIRPPMVHGPGDKGNLGLLYKIVSKGIPYPLAAFDNRRSFISIDNFSYFIQAIIGGQDRLQSGIYHIADDEFVSTMEIIALIGEATNKTPKSLAIPRPLIKLGAKLGDFLPLPLNTPRLRKLTSDLLMSNTKIKTALGIAALPVTAREGLLKTLRSF